MLKTYRRTIFHFWRGYLALLVGLLLLLLPFYYSTISLFEQRQLTLTHERLASGLRQLEQQIESLHGIAFSIGSDAEYRTFARKDAQAFAPADHYTSLKLHNEFARLCLAQPYVEDYGLLLRNNILFTRERIHFPQDDYYGSFISFGDLDKQAFFETFGHPDSLSLFLPQIQVVRNGTPYQAMVWICSMSQVLTRNPTGVFFATIPQSTLSSLLMADFSPDQAGFVLSSSAGETLMQFGLQNTPGKVHTLTASAGGLSAELLLSETLFTSMMKPVRNMLLVFFSGMGLAGILISIVLAVRSSRPVRKLAALARQVADVDDPALNSFERIGNTLTSLASSVDEYKQALTAQQIAMREQVFYSMLRETPVRQSQATLLRLERFEQCFPNFPSRYRLGMIDLQCGEISADALAQRQVALLGLIESHFSPAPYVYTNGQRAVLVLDSESSYNWFEELALLRQTARERLSMPLLISLSEEGTSCEELHALRQQARAILNLAAQEDNRELLDVWQKCNFPDQPRELPLDYAEMSQLHSLLTHGDKAGALSLLCSLGSRMCTASFLDDVMNRQMYYNIRSVLLRVKLERIDVLHSLDIPDYHGELSQNALLAQLSNCCETICAILSPGEQNRQPSFALQICRFINEHLGDSALGVGMVADHFGISAPTLQKAIRQETGNSFFDYVEQLRYEKAVLLLQTTAMPIAQIAVECGFNSNNSFYKAFKRKSTLTPAVVRQQAQV